MISRFSDNGITTSTTQKNEYLYLLRTRLEALETWLIIVCVFGGPIGLILGLIGLAQKRTSRKLFENGMDTEGGLSYLAAHSLWEWGMLCSFLSPLVLFVLIYNSGLRGDFSRPFYSNGCCWFIGLIGLLIVLVLGIIGLLHRQNAYKYMLDSDYLKGKTYLNASVACFRCVIMVVFMCFYFSLLIFCLIY